MRRSRGILSRLLGDDRGQAFVEFGFAAPILFILTLGIIDVGRAMWMNTSLGHAAREGARYASIHGDDSLDPVTDAEIIDYVKDRAIGFNGVSVTVTWDPDRGSGSSVSIEVTGGFEFFLVGFLNLSPIDLSGVSTRTVF